MMIGAASDGREPPGAKRALGFTLIEVLLVMAVVSIIMGMVLLAIPGAAGGRADVEREAERLRALLELAGDEAVVGGHELGFGVDREGYRFFLLDELQSNWLPLEEEPFQARELGATISLDLQVEGRTFPLGEERETPPVLLLSSGETTPFELRLAHTESDLVRVISSDGFSGIRYTDPAAKEED